MLMREKTEARFFFFCVSEHQTLMKLLNEFREQAENANQEAVMAQEENKELKVKIEQVRI